MISVLRVMSQQESKSREIHFFLAAGISKRSLSPRLHRILLRNHRLFFLRLWFLFMIFEGEENLTLDCWASQESQVYDDRVTLHVVDDKERKSLHSRMNVSEGAFRSSRSRVSALTSFSGPPLSARSVDRAKKKLTKLLPPFRFPREKALSGSV